MSLQPCVNEDTTASAGTSKQLKNVRETPQKQHAEAEGQVLGDIPQLLEHASPEAATTTRSVCCGSQESV